MVLAVALVLVSPIAFDSPVKREWDSMSYVITPIKLWGRKILEKPLRIHSLKESAACS